MTEENLVPDAASTASGQSQVFGTLSVPLFSQAGSCNMAKSHMAIVCIW